jgi:hypothetical protein
MANHSPVGGDRASRARRRHSQFKAHLSAFVLINVVIWAGWLATSFNSGHWRPWPLFVTVGWGIALVFQAWGAYRRPGGRAGSDRDANRRGRGTA